MTPRRHRRPSSDTTHRTGLTTTAPASSLIRRAEASLVEAWQRARARDSTRAHELAAFLVEANRTLLTRAARRYRTSRLDRAELDHAAVVGFLTAMGRYDTSRGVPLAGYASYWIRKEIQRTIAAGEYPVAIPPHRLGDLADARSVLAGDGRWPNSSAIADALAAVLSIGRLDGGRAEFLTDGTRSVEAEIEARELIQRVHDEIAKLPAALRQVVVLRYGLDGCPSRSARGVARLLGVSDFTVRQRLSKATDTLRRRLAPWRPDSA